MNDRTRPPLDVEALAEALRECGLIPDKTAADDYIDDETWAEVTSHANARAIAAAYQPTGPDDLPSHPSPGESAGFDHEVITLAAIIRRVDGNHDLGASALAEALLASGVTLTGVRSSEVDGLREALSIADGTITMMRKHLSKDHPDCAYGVLGILNDGVRRAALAGDTGPKVEPEPKENPDA